MRSLVLVHCLLHQHSFPPPHGADVAFNADSLMSDAGPFVRWFAHDNVLM